MRASPAMRALLALAAVGAVLWSAFPFVWYLLVSLTTAGHIPRRFEIPDVVTLRTYGAVIFGGDFVEVGAKFSIVPNIASSFLVAGITVALCVGMSFGAAYAFSRGAREIQLVSAIQEALDLKAKIPNAKAMGEVGGLPPEGFDFGNSPTRILEHDLTGITLIQRTGPGTQGAVGVVNADVMLATSFVVAQATMDYVLKLKPNELSFVITGGTGNDEDVACADFLEKKFTGQPTDDQTFIKRVYASQYNFIFHFTSSALLNLSKLTPYSTDKGF